MRSRLSLELLDSLREHGFAGTESLSSRWVPNPRLKPSSRGTEIELPVLVQRPLSKTLADHFRLGS
jgi:hypothetical protein